MNTQQNFISADFKVARNSEGDFFQVGEKVQHQDEEAGTAVITGFGLDVESVEVIAYTTEGWSHLDFIEKIE